MASEYKSFVTEIEGEGGRSRGRGREEQRERAGGEDGSAQPKTRNPHKDAGNYSHMS